MRDARRVQQDPASLDQNAGRKISYANHYEDKILRHLQAKGITVPQRNAKGPLPRDGSCTRNPIRVWVIFSDQGKNVLEEDLQVTEAEWLASEAPERMLEHLRGKAGDRKCRLFMVACCRRVWHAFDDEDEAGRQDAILVAERYADGLAGDDDLSEAFGDLTDGEPHRIWDCCTNLAVASFEDPSDATEYAAGAVEEAVHQGFLLAAGYYRDDPGSSSDRFEYDRSEEVKIRRAETAALADLLRDIFGSPFRPLILATAHRTPTVVSLARAAYDERHLPSGELDPHRLAVLADALEETGAQDDLTSHLRGSGTHVRGCFAVDLCLGLS